MLCSKDTFSRSRHLSSLQINWDNEKSCFDGFAREYSRFCCLRHDPFLVDSKKTEKASSSSGSAGPSLADQVGGGVVEDPRHATLIPMQTAPSATDVLAVLDFRTGPPTAITTNCCVKSNCMM